MATRLRNFDIYFKGQDNNRLTVTAAAFTQTYENQRLRFDFFLEGDTQANIYVRHSSVAIIVPRVESDDEQNEGQVFRVTMKGGIHLDIRAAYFRIGADVVAFYDADDKYLDDVYVLESEVVACVPLGTVPPEPPPIRGRVLQK